MSRNESHVAGLVELLSDPAVSAPIYDLPSRASAEIAGAFRADWQNSGAGKAGAARSFHWMFNTLGVRLICVTAALDNVRSARVIEAAGFVPMGEREAVRADGTLRRSRYWEMTREAWSALHPP